ncbi:hypothetical protein BKP45_21030 [Anaerobacillus alkalidiazotrophicus]|uniref:Uncharacterized protein n=1 Tax=Anaerobacillus alkalidiazotrophicus TaxID=472963 RepID=A0A1S2LWA8_9BACI|nr:hypothetical protein [Anaerobacillus alkalidiazotrophicus]OIJ16443.1 hypothetical protein BKP45_21305 [Anaerobacillus alkalidiazotrophicus]OIJ16493.1 hypothetical protein BKP45_21030 [Anaerobacillus alkalidiazotrophicus]
MSNFVGINIKDTSNSNITLGDGNLLLIRQNISKLLESEAKPSKETWENVHKEIINLRNIVKELTDEYEVIRDEQLTPAVSKAKREVEKLVENSHLDKKDFVEKFTNILDITNKSDQIINIVKPYIVKIAKIIGLSGIQL